MGRNRGVCARSWYPKATSRRPHRQRFVDRSAQAASERAPERLADGTVYYGRIGEIAYDPEEDKVQCHLCGGWFRCVGGPHLAYKSERYRVGCERGRVERADFQRWWM
jgi:hypothetical protein